MHWRTVRSAVVFFFFNDTATTEIYTLSLHDALPISTSGRSGRVSSPAPPTTTRAASRPTRWRARRSGRDRKSTRLNSSHVRISYAVFCLKKKKHDTNSTPPRYVVLTVRKLLRGNSHA